ncbi:MULTISPECIES: aminopeptidase P family protein [unclassified Sphingomonas]|uniref:aminopeptidase P family protein n=1 Tax=unclassified Sphingomonas TaxID=196159 RepID=UPI0006F47B5B|nr:MULTISPECIES: aminopeptidase P family protein [unclassified Sphingomonas]KQM28680.1 X-Pro aminopeptidase [Sphingomonas sp. Leaf9]KQM45383.1 X-Pro aminopeptidase [Sphingomonas sp. Leaf11]
MTSHTDLLSALRAHLATLDLTGFIVPLTDEYMSEYVGDYAQRLAWLTGFKGSAGSAVVLRETAAMFTDGRYTLQVREQVDAADWQFVQVPATTMADWLRANAHPGDRIGFDPWLATVGWVAATEAALADVGAVLVPVDANPIDALWNDRPAPSPAPMTVQDDALTGRTSADKRAAIGEWLSDRRADAVVLTALDSIAWTFNVRGSDVAHTPVALSYAIVHADGTAELFAEPGKVGEDVARHLGNAVTVRPMADFAATLGQFAGKRIAADPDRAVAAIHDALRRGGATIITERDPTVLAKAIKNPVEIAGHRSAQARDGAAMVRFLKWFEETAPSGTLTELSASDRLEAIRGETGLLRDLSFDTISATGAHAASPHYKATVESNAPILPGQLYLIDSGGQYADGTTDITRVMPVGEVSEEMRDRFTRVLKGHIAIDTAIFPDGTLGGHIDGFARRPLWEAGLDYAHGTGHGIGAFLSVHEGPQRIGAPNYPGGGPLEPLRAGMMLSNEPGYYKAGDYGIRIENLLLVVLRDIPGGDLPMLGFETLTFVPIERSLIVPALLSDAERTWVDGYHARVEALLTPLLDRETAAWLAAKCAPLS